MNDERRSNRLAGETSPYLLQHAHNPVDWYPWGKEALLRAAAEDRPILLSIGYAACHWCHVMERESFEDEETGRFMNEHFVCIKVDREERPDLDAIYMDAVQSMTGQGGWPMTVFLSPDGAPFFAGTYFPRESGHGLPSFRQVLDAVDQAWREQRPRIGEQGRRVVQSIGRTAALRQSADPLSERVLGSAFAAMRRAYDPRWGGFGGAPKFPQPMNLEFMLRCHLRGYDGALEMVTTTLDRMAGGGMYDHVGGGFHRYSVDERWHVPHFEKMLYDNAQLAGVYVHAFQVTGHERYRRVATETLDYLLREMRHPGGGFHSSQDADSEGVEGKFYVWPWEELVDVAGSEVASYLGALPQGNWEGTNVLWIPPTTEGEGADPSLPTEELLATWEIARPKLFEVRQKRGKPAVDDKILGAWNGLAIAAFAEAGRVLGETRFAEAARQALWFCLENLRPAGRVLRAWRDGRTAGPGYLDDYACLALGGLAVSETTFDPRVFPALLELTDDMLRLFQDGGGGFFQTGVDAESLVIRPKELFDNAVPSGSSAAAELLLKMALLTGEPAYERAAVSALRVVRNLMERAPLGFGRALCALDLYVGPSREIAIVGDPGGKDTTKLLAEVYRRFLPNAVVALADPLDVGTSEVPLLRGREPVGGKATAYVCERFACRQPVTDPMDLAEQLGA